MLSYICFAERLTAVVISFLLCAAPAVASLQLPADDWANYYVAGKAAFAFRKYSLAEKEFNTALTATGGDVSKALSTYDALSDCYAEQKKHQEEKKVLEQSLRLMESDCCVPKDMLGTTFQKLSIACFFLHDLRQSYHYAVRGEILMRESMGADSLEEGVALNNLGWVEFAMKMYPDARDHFKKAVGIMTSIMGDGSTDYAVGCLNLANTYAKLGDKVNYRLWLQRSDDAFKKSYGSESMITAPAETAPIRKIVHEVPAA